MPKNNGKGGKNRRRGKNEGEEKRELVFKEDGQGMCRGAARRGSWPPKCGPVRLTCVFP